MIRPFIVLVVLLAFSHIAFAEVPPTLPEGFGLSGWYEGDRGIDGDPAVLLAEDFESADLAGLTKNWNSVSNKDGKVIAFHDDSPAQSAGRRCLQMTATVAENEGGHLYKRLPRGVDTAFARFYVKFPRDGGYIYHFVHSWRTTDELKINFFWLLHFVTETNQQRNRTDLSKPVTVWFDNIVVSEQYVGPIKPRQ